MLSILLLSFVLHLWSFFFFSLPLLCFPPFLPFPPLLCLSLYTHLFIDPCLTWFVSFCPALYFSFPFLLHPFVVLPFLDATTHLYKRLCRCVGPSVGPSRVIFDQRIWPFLKVKVIIWSRKKTSTDEVFLSQLEDASFSPFFSTLMRKSCPVLGRMVMYIWPIPLDRRASPLNTGESQNFLAPIV